MAAVYSPIVASVKQDYHHSVFSKQLVGFSVDGHRCAFRMAGLQILFECGFCGLVACRICYELHV